MGHFRVAVCHEFDLEKNRQLIFHLNGSAPGLALKLRHAATRKWAIRSSFRFRVSDNLHTDSPQNDPGVKREKRYVLHISRTTIRHFSWANWQLRYIETCTRLPAGPRPGRLFLGGSKFESNLGNKCTPAHFKVNKGTRTPPWDGLCFEHFPKVKMPQMFLHFSNKSKKRSRWCFFYEFHGLTPRFTFPVAFSPWEAGHGSYLYRVVRKFGVMGDFLVFCGTKFCH